MRDTPGVCNIPIPYMCYFYFSVHVVYFAPSNIRIRKKVNGSENDLDDRPALFN